MGLNSGLSVKKVKIIVCASSKSNRTLKAEISHSLSVSVITSDKIEFGYFYT